MTEANIRKAIAENIAKHRKNTGMTQIDLSHKINYSDKSISKWERGDGIPDVMTLIQLSEIFGVSVNELIYPMQPQETAKSANHAESGNSTDSRFGWKQFFITILSVVGVWFVAFLLICLFRYLAPSAADIWNGRIICYALAGSFTVFLIFASMWWPRAWIFIAITGIIWAGALSVFVTFYTVPGAAIVFTLAGILELPVIVCYLWRCLAKHQWLIPYPFPRNNSKK